MLQLTGVLCKTNEYYIYTLACMLFLDNLGAKCESFRETETEMVKLSEVLDRHAACIYFDRVTLMSVFANNCIADKDEKLISSCAWDKEKNLSP